MSRGVFDFFLLSGWQAVILKTSDWSNKRRAAQGQILKIKMSWNELLHH